LSKQTATAAYGIMGLIPLPLAAFLMFSSSAYTLAMCFTEYVELSIANAIMLIGFYSAVLKTTTCEERKDG